MKFPIHFIAACMVFILAACNTASLPPATPTPALTLHTAVPTKSTAAVAAAQGNTLRINIGTYPETIDPQKASFVNEIATLKLIYEGLTRLDEKLNIIPGAAESWKYNSAATQLVFKIRNGLKYSDGSLLNAKRFEYAILRNIDPTTAGDYSSITNPIKGAKEWNSADPSMTSKDDMARLKAAVGVHAVDASGQACTGYDQADCLTLVIDLTAPAPYFHKVMALWVTYPVKEELVTTSGDAWQNDPTKQLGNGPMVLDTLEQNTRMLFKPNPNYYRGQAKVNIEYHYVTDSAMAFEAYKNNQLDIAGIAAEDLGAIQSDPVLSKETRIYPGNCTFSLTFHNLKPPFDDQKVREAFAYSFDRESWVKDILKGLGLPTLTWIPKGSAGYDPNEDRFKYDPARTKELLTAAGYSITHGVLTRGGATFPISLTFMDTPRDRVRNAWIANKWKNDLDLVVELKPVESTTFTTLTKDVKTAPQAFILDKCADYPDPQNWLSVYWKSETTFARRIGFVDATFDSLVNKADVELDTARRLDLYTQAQKEVISAVPGVMAWNSVNAYLVKPNIKGLLQTAQDSDWPGSIDPLSISIAAQ